MTIRMKIENLDSRDSAVVAVAVQSTAEGSKPEYPTELKGGESVEKYVHSGQKIVVWEVKNG